jgi:hypothetical protein
MLDFLSSRASPMPDSCSSRGEWIPPAARITSFLAVIVVVVALRPEENCSC